ncbi:hypothetical protein ACOMHN_028711 [Nucella lapillus]
MNKRSSQLFNQSAEGRGETAGRSRIRLTEDRQPLRTLQGAADGRTDPGSSKAGREEGQPSVTFLQHKKSSSGKLPDLRTERFKIRRDSNGKRAGVEGRQSGKDGALKKGHSASGGLAPDTPRQGRGKQEDGALPVSFQTSPSSVAKRGSQACVVVDSVSDGTTVGIGVFIGGVGAAGVGVLHWGVGAGGIGVYIGRVGAGGISVYIGGVGAGGIGVYIGGVGAGGIGVYIGGVGAGGVYIGGVGAGGIGVYIGGVGAGGRGVYIGGVGAGGVYIGGVGAGGIGVYIGGVGAGGVYIGGVGAGGVYIGGVGAGGVYIGGVGAGGIGVYIGGVGAGGIGVYIRGVGAGGICVYIGGVGAGGIGVYIGGVGAGGVYIGGVGARGVGAGGIGVYIGGVGAGGVYIGGVGAGGIGVYIRGVGAGGVGVYIGGVGAGGIGVYIGGVGAGGVYIGGVGAGGIGVYIGGVGAGGVYIGGVGAGGIGVYIGGVGAGGIGVYIGGVGAGGIGVYIGGVGAGGIGVYIGGVGAGGVYIGGVGAGGVYIGGVGAGGIGVYIGGVGAGGIGVYIGGVGAGGVYIGGVGAGGIGVYIGGVGAGGVYIGGVGAVGVYIGGVGAGGIGVYIGGVGAGDVYIGGVGAGGIGMYIGGVGAGGVYIGGVGAGGIGVYIGGVGAGDKLGLVFPKIVEQQSYTSFNVSTKDVNFFTPSIQVEHDNADDGRTVTEIYIRGWEVELAMLEVLLRCWVSLPLLRLVQLWNVALDSGTVTLLGSQLPFCYSLHTLVLDANSLRGMPVSLLLGPSSVLRHLSLRFCRLTDIEAYGISQGLVSPVSTNACLLSLNLSNNQITNVGVTHIAQSLRCNSSLLTLNLASNKVGDEGVVQLSTTFSKFPLTHDQLVQRRQIMSQRLEKENISPRISHQSPSSSHVSAHREKEKDGHRDKDTHLKERDSLKRGRELVRDSRDPREGKDKEVKDKFKFPILKKKVSKDHLVGSKDVVESHSKHKLLEPRLRLPSKKSRSKRSIQELPDEIMSPLIVDGEVRDGQLWITGNRSVISLNLSRNLIGKKGVKALRMAVEVQRETHTKIPNVAVGLLRIVLHRNSVAESDEDMQAINKILHCRDPCLKVPRVNLQRVNITPCSLPLAL